MCARCERAPEYIEALTELQAAVEKVNRASGSEGLVMDWFLVVADHTIDPEGGSNTGLQTYSSEEQSIYRSAGLIEYAKMEIKSRIAEGLS